MRFFLSLLLLCCLSFPAQAQNETATSTLRIGMTSVYVDDPLKAFGFYTDTLGFKEYLFMPEGQLAIVVSAIDSNGTTLLLEPTQNPIAARYQKEIYTAGFPAMVLMTDELHAEYERLRGLGVRFKKAPTRTPWGVEAIFDDGHGNWIQLHQLLP